MTKDGNRGLKRHSRSKHPDEQETAALTNPVPKNMEIIERILSEIVMKLRDKNIYLNFSEGYCVLIRKIIHIE